MKNGLVSYIGLVELVERGVITDVPHEHINGASIDVCIGNEILVERADNRLISLRDRDQLTMSAFTIHGESGYALAPGEFILAHTVEKFNLPNDIACEFKLKSSGARIGLNNALATWCDPGWHGSALTLELQNINRHHPIVLCPGDRIGQMLFYHVDPVPEDRSYAVRGRYNGDASVQQSKVNPEGGAQ
jgi:dCTP deaminase